MLDLAGQVAMISGGLGDIGRAVAKAIAQAGADVAISDLADAQAGQSFVSNLETYGIRARYDSVDVTDAQAMHGWVDQVEETLGCPTIAVMNAAVVERGNLLTIDPAQWRKQLAVNLDGALLMSQAVAKRMVNVKQSGRFVFVGSWAAHRAHPQIPAYCVSKAGLRMLMQCMALELAPHGICVNEIAPGYVDAGLTKQFFKDHPENREKAEQKVPVRQLITAEQVARQVVWLCDPDNPHVTGQAIVMDGGLSLVSPAYQVQS